MTIARRVAPGARLLDIDDLSAILRRRWYIPIFTVVLMVTLAAIVGLRTPALYDADSRVKLDASQTADIVSLLDPDAADDAAIQTEIEQIASRPAASAVARQLDMPEVKAAPDGQVPESVIDWLLRDLTVVREEGTYIVDVSYRGRNPVWAARVTNAFVNEYLRESVARRTGKAGRQEQMLNGQMVALGADVREADGRVARYRAANNTPLDAAQLTIADQQVSPLVAQVAAAETSAAQARATLAAARSQEAAGQSGAITRVNAVPVSTDLASQRTTLLKTQQAILERYGDRHPDALAVASQIASIDRQIADQRARAIAELDANARAKEATAAAIRQQLDRLRSQQAANGAKQVMADALQRDADAKRQTYTALAVSSELAAQDRRDLEPKAVVVDIAAPPDDKVWPHYSQLGLLGIMSGLLLGLFVIMLPELLRGGLRTAKEVEGQLDLPFLGSLPAIRRRRWRKARPESVTLPSLIRADPMSEVAERLRMLRAEIMSDPKRRVIAVVSGEPGEGRSSLVAALADVMALCGDRVAIVGSGPSTTPDECDRIDLATLLSGRGAVEPSALRQKLVELAQSFDFLLIDTPPALRSADAQLIAAAADAALLVVRWSRTQTRVVQELVAQLRQVQVTPFGIILTQARDPHGTDAIRWLAGRLRPLRNGLRRVRTRLLAIYYRLRPLG